MVFGQEILRVRNYLLVLHLLGGLFCAQAALCAPLERGTAITDPDILRKLDLGERSSSVGLGLGALLNPDAAGSETLSNDVLFALPAMAPVRKAIDAEFDRYIARHRAATPQQTIGVGTGFDLQLFDRSALYSSQSRFLLAGIVNRMDRAFVAPATCGEIRLIYRLTRTEPAAAGEGVVASPRLPMTLNVVLNAKPVSAPATTTCAEIARRWLSLIDETSTGELLKRLVSAGGALEFVRPDAIDRIETNLQVAHMPKSAARDFRTDYLLKVFNYNSQSKFFDEAPMENQIDRDRLLADINLGREFRQWLLDPRHLSEFDRGTALIPEKFLANSVLAPTPTGLARSDLQPSYGLMQSEDVNAVFKDSDVVAALKAAADGGITLQNIRSPAGFARRLNDITCAGCHQTRGIGGFHFPGVDWMAAKPSNTTIVPASPHFFGDQIRRRNILTALSIDKSVDFSRGFSDRPQLRGNKELAGTEYSDGWGASCYRQIAGLRIDPSFSTWGCAKDLTCQAIDRNSRTPFGMCFVGNR
jgi:hypothetical protein